MTEIERSLRSAAITIELADPYSADARSCIDAYFAELEELFDEGFNPMHTVSATPDELVPPAGYLLLARLDKEPVGCGALKILGGGYAEIKRMWVSPRVRGLGVAQSLLNALETQANEAGIDIVRLDTNRNLTKARSLYARNGYMKIAAYNANPYAHHWFEKRLKKT